MDDSQVKEDLAYLRRVIEDSRRVVIDNGMHLLLWGILVVVGMILTYAYVHFGLNFPEAWMWILLIGAGWLLSIWIGWVKAKKTGAGTFLERVMRSLWIGLGITMTISGFLGPATRVIPSLSVIPLLSFLLATGFLVTSVIQQEHLLRYAAIGWWIGGLISMFWPGDYTILLFAGMMIAFQIIPGLYLYRKWKIDERSPLEAETES